MSYTPGVDPWPGTPGGACSPHWGGYISVWLRASLSTGEPWRMGPDPNDQLDVGNVMGPVDPDPIAGLWIDLACDVTELAIDNGATRTDGIFSRNEAATLTATLLDPRRDYDPTNPDSPWVLQGKSRLISGQPIEAFCEVVDDVGSVNRARNASFENGWDQWQGPGQEPFATWTLDSLLWAPDAAWSAKMVCLDPAFNGNPGHYGNVYQIPADDRDQGYDGPWTGSAWIIAPAGRSIGLGMIRYYMVDGQVVAPWTVGPPHYPADAQNSYLYTNHLASGVWERVTLTTPADVSSAQCYGIDFRIGVGGANTGWVAGDVMQVDSCQLERGNVATPYVPDRPATVARRHLFTGRIDNWREPWTPHPAERRATVTATDAVKQLVHLNYGETAPVGAGDTTDQRMNRILDYFGWTGPRAPAPTPSTVTLQATTLAQSAWELLNRTTDDELGFVHVRPDGTLRWVNRGTWETATSPVLVIGCPDARDIVTDVVVADLDVQLRNAVYAARTGGTQQVVRNQTSIDTHGGYEVSFKRTDLGLADDGQAALWADLVVQLYAFPPPEPVAVALSPAIVRDQGASWLDVLDVMEVTDLVRLIWQPPAATTPNDQTFRVMGTHHAITYRRWDMAWNVIAATSAASKIWTMGPDANDRLDDGNVIGLMHSQQRGERRDAANVAA